MQTSNLPLYCCQSRLIVSEHSCSLTVDCVEGDDDVDAEQLLGDDKVENDEVQLVSLLLLQLSKLVTVELPLILTTVICS